jgi:hypothetical protein
MESIITKSEKEKIKVNQAIKEPVNDIRKRQFIKKGILGLIAGLGIAIFSKVANARYFFSDGTSQAAAAPSQSDQAALEAETNEDTYAPPDLIKHSPGVAKAWLSIAAAGTNESPSYNVNATTDTATGDRIINLTTALSGNRPAGGHGWTRGGGPTAGDGIIIPETMTGGNTWVVRVWDSGGKTDHAHYHVIFGDI